MQVRCLIQIYQTSPYTYGMDAFLRCSSFPSTYSSLVYLLVTFLLNGRDLNNTEQLSDWLDSAYSYLAMVDYPYSSNFLMPLPAYPIKEVGFFVINYCLLFKILWIMYYWSSCLTPTFGWAFVLITDSVYNFCFKKSWLSKYAKMTWKIKYGGEGIHINC